MDKLIEILIELEGEPFLNVFIESGLTKESLKLLKPSHLDTLIGTSQFGPRVIFEHNLLNWQAQQGIKTQAIHTEACALLANEYRGEDIYYIHKKGKKPGGSLYAKYHSVLLKLRRDGLISKRDVEPTTKGTEINSCVTGIYVHRTYATDFVKEKLIEQIAKPATKSKRKVTVVGSGQVGIATVISILAQNVSNEVCIIDANEKLVNAEAKDIQHGSAFLRDAKVIASKVYESSKDSAVCIVTAGARQKEGQTRLDLLKTNVDILSQIVPQLVKYSPKTVIVMITNPCDVLTYAAWKLSGLPVERVFATGTHLDTSRFRYFIAQRLGVSASSVQGYIIGEHGDSSVPVWSGVSVGGVRFSDLNKCIGSEGDTDGWNEIHKQVVKAAYEVIAGKGYTNWAIGLTAASVASMILDNKNEVATVSTLAKDHQCIEQDVFLSLPVVIGANGITSFVNLQLSEMEQKNLCKSAEILDKATKSISEKSAENKKKK